jgi:radical SAM superfamily enzyme YgiQ (UPF0313 family)
MAFHNTTHEQVPHLLIEIQEAPQNVKQILNNGKRIRDIIPSVILRYDFFHKSPIILNRAEDAVMEDLKPSIYKLYNMAMKFIDMEDSPTLKEDLIIKGNIKANRKITFIDCRDFTSFIDRNISEHNLKEVMCEIGKRNTKVDSLLIFPYMDREKYASFAMSKDNLAEGYLSASAKEAGFSIETFICDGETTTKQILEKVEKIKPKSIGFSVPSERAYPIVREYVKGIKKSTHSPIFLGGLFATVASKEILNDCPQIDTICLGEGEEIIVELLNAITKNEDYTRIKGLSFRDKNGNVITNGVPRVVENLDNLPIPSKKRFDDLPKDSNMDFYHLNISAGRGCWGGCSFCSTNKLTGQRKRRVRSPQKVVAEIKENQEKYKINHFRFIDDLFIDKLNKQWIFNFCSEMKKQNVNITFHAEARVDCIFDDIISVLKEVGLSEVFVGLESGNQEMLRKYKKGHTIKQSEEAVKILQKHNIATQYGYIMIDPRMTFTQLKDNANFLFKIGGYAKQNMFNKLNLYFETEIYKEFCTEKEGEFYKQKKCDFIDSKVALFSDLVFDAKSAFFKYDEKANKIILDKIHCGVSKEEVQNSIENLSSFETKIQVEITKKALNFAERKQTKDENWALFVKKKQAELYDNLRKIQKPKVKN